MSTPNLRPKTIHLIYNYFSLFIKKKCMINRGFSMSTSWFANQKLIIQTVTLKNVSQVLATFFFVLFFVFPISIDVPEKFINFSSVYVIISLFRAT